MEKEIMAVQARSITQSNNHNKDIIMPKKRTKKQVEEIMKTRAKTWRDDGMFLEFCTYHGAGNALDDPCSSGFNLIGAGGRDIDEDADFNEETVTFYLQELDSGDDLTVRLTPESARSLAEHLKKWADDAENSADDDNIEHKFEAQRRRYYANNGL